MLPQHPFYALCSQEVGNLPDLLLGPVNRLTSSGMPDTSALSACNSKPDGSIPEEPAGYLSSKTQAQVAENPNTPAETLKRLAGDQDQDVQKAARERTR